MTGSNVKGIEDLASKARAGGKRSSNTRKINLRQASSQWAFTAYTLNIFEGWQCAYMTHLVYQVELCPKTQRPHLQGFIKFTKHIRRRQLQRLMDSPGLHCAPALGSPEENRVYCTKEKSRMPNTDPVVIGPKVWSNNRQGSRRDLEILIDMVKDGMTDFDIMMADPANYLRYQSHIRSVRYTYLQHTLPDYQPCEAHCYFGPTRTNKTRTALAKAKAHGSTFKVTFDSNYWMDGYDGQENLIIDEYAGQLPLTVLLNLLDNYKLRLPIKGGFVMRQWKKVFITSNIDPREWYKFADEEHIAALGERFHTVTRFIPKKRKVRKGWIIKDRHVGESVLPSPTSGQDHSQLPSTAFTFSLPSHTVSRKCRDVTNGVTTVRKNVSGNRN